MPELEGRAEFVQQNANALLNESDLKISRQRKRVTFLENSRREMREHMKSKNAKIEHLEAELLRWKRIASLREHAIREAHMQIDRIWMCEHVDEESLIRLLKKVKHERKVACENAFNPLKEADDAD